MREFEQDSVFEIEALRQTLNEALAMYDGLRSGPTSQVRFDGKPKTLDRRIEQAKFVLRLLDWWEDDFYDDRWEQITFWLNRDGMNWRPAP